MKFLQAILVALILLSNLAIAQPSFANKPPLTSNPDYIAVTNDLSKATDPTEIAKLQFEKYVIETGESFAECRNLTANPLPVYGKKSKLDGSTFDNTLYTLASGGTTNEDWNCQGIYLEKGLNNDGQPVAIKLVTGTQMVAKADPETGAIDLNFPVTRIFKNGEINWLIPTTTEELSALTLPQAPLD
ncbi:hypothetical protein [Pseudanabaena sp. UWO310]|uniref:hypothetical protein n=1 Tax=Pseudanabaena sp. UWO310 TaxID=2480795 RepID=UPI0011581829|nr:hypothetical protein [Pseudanabaena sp. UWO310]TYQ30557.1 hypothetical protein PseudUWO310_07925 [Pseudanabaena sp. UWO310]